jgi:hypothetical protein
MPRADVARHGDAAPVSDGDLSIVDAKTGRACPNLIVSALYTHKGVLYLRVYDYLGEKLTTIRATLGNKPVKFVPANLIYEDQGKMSDQAEIRAYQVATFRLVAG